MAAHVMCLTSAGGLPLFTRKKGEGDLLPFSVVASLNGVHMFAKTQEIDLLSTATTETTFIWKEMEDSTELLEMLVSSVFQAMIMTVGIEEIRTCRNIERLKRELRACYPLVDRLLECLDTTSRVDLLGLTEVILCHENISLQALLDAYCECLGSLHGCLVARGRTLVATASWWALQPSERKLLALLVAGDGQATARDDTFDHLNGKFLLSGNQLQSDSKKDVYRLDILCTFYYQGAGMLWKNSGTSKAVESYWCSEYHKCHAMQQGNTLLCVLYAAAVPTDTMRHITKQSFKILTTDKQMCW
ncbi:LOW QUALITY PROTEIN: Fuzzy-like protein [Gryllus bimaculatus]|nr:LOW QUALITY PROTEIN: Fuzzy-like protein [Gryllus bimaculatus]